MKTKATVLTIVTLFLVGLFALAFNPSAMAHTEADPFVTDLIAAQHYDAGDVSVWNDGDNLYVRYETTGDWSMSETHLHVALSLADIPQQNGNPPPGQFDYGMDHAPGTTEHTYAIDLNGWEPDDELFIAAHAVVCGPGEEPMFAQGWLATVPLYTWPDGINAGSVTVAISGENLVVTFETVDGWLMIDTSLYLDPTTPPAYPPPWADFPYQHPGLLNATSDTYSISLTSLGIECGDLLYISAHANLVKYNQFGQPIYRHGWGEEDLSDGWQKYFSVIIPCEYVCETAWGDGLDFPGRNWAMYFTYTVQ